MAKKGAANGSGAESAAAPETKTRSKKKPQGQLPGMPARTQLEKDGDSVIEKWEELQKRKAALSEAKKLLMASLRKSNRTYITLLDSKGVPRKLELSESESISIVKAAKDE